MQQNDYPTDWEKLREWFPVIRRAMRDMTIGNNQELRITVICDKTGKPVYWTKPEWSQLEPRSRVLKTEDIN